MNKLSFAIRITDITKQKGERKKDRERRERERRGGRYIYVIWYDEVILGMIGESGGGT